MNHIQKVIIPILLILLLSSVVYSAVVADDTAGIQSINDRIEKSKAETIRAVKDSQNATASAVVKNIDENFGYMETRFQEFFKESKRDFGIIVLCAMVAGFVLAQIIRIQIEAGKRRATIRRVFELEERLISLENDATRLTKVVLKLKDMETKYSEGLKKYTAKQPFLSGKTIAFGMMMLCIGLLIMLVLGMIKVI